MSLIELRGADQPDVVVHGTCLSDEVRSMRMICNPRRRAGGRQRNDARLLETTDIGFVNVTRDLFHRRCACLLIVNLSEHHAVRQL